MKEEGVQRKYLPRITTTRTSYKWFEDFVLLRYGKTTRPFPDTVSSEITPCKIQYQVGCSAELSLQCFSVKFVRLLAKSTVIPLVVSETHQKLPLNWKAKYKTEDLQWDISFVSFILSIRSIHINCTTSFSQPFKQTMVMCIHHEGTAHWENDPPAKPDLILISPTGSGPNVDMIVTCTHVKKSKPKRNVYAPLIIAFTESNFWDSAFIINR